MPEYIVNVPENKINAFTALMDKMNIALQTYAEHDVEVPEWHKDIVLNRIKNAKAEDYVDWDTMMEMLENNG
jgi:hypothetical protein